MQIRYNPVCTCLVEDHYEHRQVTLFQLVQRSALQMFMSIKSQKWHDQGDIIRHAMQGSQLGQNLLVGLDGRCAEVAECLSYDC